MADYLRESGVLKLWEKIKTLLSNKQDKLVSGTNIKTINGTSLLGSGDITVEGGGSNDKHATAYPFGMTDKPYHRVASTSIAVTKNLNTNISFYVSEFYKDKSCGILNVSVRFSANKTAEQYIGVECSPIGSELDILWDGVQFHTNTTSFAVINTQDVTVLELNQKRFINFGIS